MNKEQLEALINFIKEQAAYSADIANDEEASHRAVQAAERDLRRSFEAGDKAP